MIRNYVRYLSYDTTVDQLREVFERLFRVTSRAILWVLLSVLVSCANFLEAAPRNVVLVVTDDQGQDAVCYGNPVVQTPHLDALARDGTLLPFAFCTTASCSASRAVILTGLHNHANGQYGHQHSYHKFNSYHNIISLPVYLRLKGYRTARCGKYHVAPESVYHFERVIPGPTRNSVAMANQCASFLRESDKRPFFLYFCTSDPHRSGQTTDELPSKPNRFGNPQPGRPGYAGIEEVTYDPTEVLVPGFLPDTPICREEIAQYYQSVSRIDQGLGRLVELLKTSGHWEETLLIYISDHGIAMPGAKTTLYEGGMRSPCVIQNPSCVVVPPVKRWSVGWT